MKKPGMHILTVEQVSVLFPYCRKDALERAELNAQVKPERTLLSKTICNCKFSCCSLEGNAD